MTDQENPAAATPEEDPNNATPDEELEKTSAASGGRSTGVMLALGCGVCIIIIGIVALVLWLTGYFTIKEPCVQIFSFTVSGLELGTGDSDAADSNPLVGALNTLSGGLIGSVSKATINLDLVLQVNNTNSYKLNYKQLDTGYVKIPEFMLNFGTPTDGPVETLNDFPVGNWDIDDGTLPKKSATLLPVSVSAEIDLADPATIGLAPIFLSGGEMAFLIKGGIEGSNWVPGLTGDVRFLCLAQVEDVLQFGADAKIFCRTSLDVGGIISQEGVIQTRNLQEILLEQPPTDPSCWV
ncbi:expressed unknown protein [Seminavis robusta]|uniref:Uncharacterized protein n=1 Tax=Seminavis robusta TaxID=568900 RepID=A0A9N8D9D9_9STRA|nr:expressed unknown protein [Seminavis robusta]|eukprot:Sro50_g029100.1 n/a (295) ;mRNA; f:81429-82313